jgi:hypothetical protein
LKNNNIRQMQLLVRHYLREEPAQEMDDLIEQYAEALFLEERQIEAQAAAIAKAFGGK